KDTWEPSNERDRLDSPQIDLDPFAALLGPASRPESRRVSVQHRGCRFRVRVGGHLEGARVQLAEALGAGRQLGIRPASRTERAEDGLDPELGQSGFEAVAPSPKPPPNARRTVHSARIGWVALLVRVGDDDALM